MNDLIKMSDIDLTQELKNLSHKAQKLKSSIPSVLDAPGKIVEKAKLEDEIAGITEQQVEIAKILLERDQQREVRKVKQLAAQSEEGKQKAEKLVGELAEFAEKVSIAFRALGQEYLELEQASKEIYRINDNLIRENLPQCVRASLKIEPHNLRRLLKQQFRECFGAAVTDIFLPQYVEAFDINQAVKDIQKSVTGG